MKKVSTLLVMILFVFTMSAQDQNMIVKRQGQGYMRANPHMVAPKIIPDLTPEQQKEIESIKIKFQKESLQISNEIREKRAQLRTLEQVDKPNLKAINAKIDEMTNLQNKKLKLIAEHKSKVRSLLTDEQRVQFDLRGEMHKNRKFRNR